MPSNAISFEYFEALLFVIETRGAFRMNRLTGDMEYLKAIKGGHGTLVTPFNSSDQFSRVQRYNKEMTGLVS